MLLSIALVVLKLVLIAFGILAFTGLVFIGWMLVKSHKEMDSLKEKVREYGGPEVKISGESKEEFDEAANEKKKYERWVDDIILRATGGLAIGILIFVVMSSCGSARHYQKIHGIKQSGTYTIKCYRNNVATFKEFPGRFVIPSDTLKKGDKIFVTVVRPAN